MSANIVPTIYVHDESDWTTRAAWAWWHWLDETWLGWWQFGYGNDGRRCCDTLGHLPRAGRCGMTGRYDFIPGCSCGKRQYGDKGIARQAAARRSKDSGENIVAYKCPVNRHVWHVGHTDPNRQSHLISRENKRAALVVKQEREAS